MTQKHDLTSVAIILIIGLLLPLVPAHADDSFPTQDLIGKWEGKSRHPFNNNKSSIKNEQDSINVIIEIHVDGSVTGSVGKAALKECRLSKNRGWLGRKLNMKSDFIVKSGYLAGKVLPEDPSDIKEFTLPFNIINDRLTGTVMILQGWKYPYPLTSHLKLSKRNSTDQISKKQ